MLGIMGVGVSTFSAARLFLVGMDEEYIMSEFDDIKQRLRRCNDSYAEYQTQEFAIPSKINTLKNHIDYNDKMYVMIKILEDEWLSIRYRMNEIRRQNMMS